MSQETQTTITITGAAGRYEVHDSRASAFAGLPSRFERLIEAEAHVAAVASTGDIVVGKIEDPNFRHAASMLRAHLAARRAGRSHNFARAAIAIIIAYTSRGIPRGEVDRILEAAVDASTAASSARSLEDRRREAGADEALDHRTSAAAVRATIRATVVLDRIVSGLPAPKVADYEGALAVFLELEVRSQTWRRSGGGLVDDEEVDPAGGPWAPGHRKPCAAGPVTIPEKKGITGVSITPPRGYT